MKITKAQTYDYKKIANAINGTGRSMEDLSKEMGFNKNFLYNTLRNESISDSAMRLLAFAIGENYEDFIRAEDHEIDRDTLKRIKDAESEIVKKATAFHEIEYGGINAISNQITQLNSRTIAIDALQKDMMRQFEKMANLIMDINERTKEINFHHEPLDIAKAFLEGLLAGTDEMVDSTIIALANHEGIDVETLKLAKDDLGYRTITRMIGKSKYKFWAKPYGA